jgi:hypothetical protein
MVEQEPERSLPAEPEADAFFGPDDDVDAAPGAASIGDLMQRFESGLARKKQAIERAPFSAPLAAAPEPAPTRPATASVAAPAPAAPVSAPAAPGPVEPAPVVDAQVGHRLRSAIAGLQRASGTNG